MVILIPIIAKTEHPKIQTTIVLTLQMDIILFTLTQHQIISQTALPTDTTTLHEITPTTTSHTQTTTTNHKQIIHTLITPTIKIKITIKIIKILTQIILKNRLSNHHQKFTQIPEKTPQTQNTSKEKKIFYNL